MLRRKLKQRLPLIYEWYLHLKRKKLIKEIEKRKKTNPKKYPSIISMQYKKRIGHELNWNSLNTYTEKMQWEKLYNNDINKSVLADKYEVRKWVTEKIGKEYLIPLLGTWDNFEDIEFESLPEKFVLKTNHGSGTNVIVKEKDKLNKKIVKRKFDDWLKMDFGFISMERHYSKIKPKIIAEQYIETDYGELQDYKFLCFDGKPYYCWVDLGRYSNHTRNVYDLNWKLQPWSQEWYDTYKEDIPRPKNFEKMIEIAEVLSAGFAQVRVDLYNVDGKIFFGEMTFTNGGGYDRILPNEYDKMLGDLWKLPIQANKKFDSK